VVGDGQGWVGIGKGKAAEVPVAISKAVEQAKKNLVHVSLSFGNDSHEVHGLFVLSMSPKACEEGDGIIAGGAVRAVVEVVGVHNVIGENAGPRDPFNAVRATLKALSAEDAEDVLRCRSPVGDARIG